MKKGRLFQPGLYSMITEEPASAPVSETAEWALKNAPAAPWYKRAWNWVKGK